MAKSDDQLDRELQALIADALAHPAQQTGSSNVSDKSKPQPPSQQQQRPPQQQKSTPEYSNGNPGNPNTTPVQKVLFKVWIPSQGHISLDYVPTMTLQEVLQIVAKKRRFEASKDAMFTYKGDKTSLDMSLTLDQLKEKVVQLHLPGIPAEEPPLPPRKASNFRISEWLKVMKKEQDSSAEVSKFVDGTGWLTKVFTSSPRIIDRVQQEGGRIKSWRRRYMVLKNKSIFYARKQVES